MLPAKYRNNILNQDVMEILRALPDDSVDLVYGDPDYNVGINYSGEKFTRKWNEYIDWYSEIAKESLRILKPAGNMFFINYPRQNAYLRVTCLDEIACDVQDYVWTYNTNVGHSKRRFTTAHRSVLHATKSKHNNFYKEQVAQPYQNPTDKRILQRLREGHAGRMPYSWFYYDLVKNVSHDKTFHACQIPLGLVKLLFNAGTKEGDDIFILFGGSGSEICLAKEMKRNYLSCEINRKYYKMIMDRLSQNGDVALKYRMDFIQNKHKRRHVGCPSPMFAE